MGSTMPSSMGPPPTPSIPTQADRLPGFKHIIIPKIKKLSKAHDIYYWGNCIQISLCARNLNDLTSSTFLRPAADHPTYNNWAKWSRFVSEWLVQNVDENFTTYFRDNQSRLEFADTTYKEIQSLEMGKSPELSHMTTELLKLWNMHRPQFQGIDQYVDAWRDQVLVCQGLTIGFNYFSATKIMLHEVEGDMPVLATFINLQLEDYEYESADNMSYNQFNSIVRGIIGAVQKENWRPL